MAEHRYTGIVHASAERVFAYLADPRHLPAYLPLMTDARLAGEHVEIDTTIHGATRTLLASFEVEPATRTIAWGSLGNPEYYGRLAVTESGEHARIAYALTTPLEHTLEPYLRAATTFVATALGVGHDE